MVKLHREKIDLRARRRRLAALAVVVLMAVGCADDHPGAAIADKIRAASSPIVREIVYSPSAFSQSPYDQIHVYLLDDATDAQALDLWCTVLVPAGVDQLPARAVMLRKYGELTPTGGRSGSTLIPTDPVVCPANGPSVT